MSSMTYDDWHRAGRQRGMSWRKAALFAIMHQTEERYRALKAERAERAYRRRALRRERRRICLYARSRLNGRGLAPPTASG